MIKEVGILLVLCLAGCHAKFNDCHERWKAGERVPGVYEIQPKGMNTTGKVYCDHSVNGTMTVIQRRIYGTENFNRPLVDYQRGFGHAQGDYWVGLDMISALTQSGNTKLRIDVVDWNTRPNKRYATYSHFQVMPHTQYYQMYVYGYSGNIPDDMGYHSGNYFFTYDYPDQYNCATNMGAGWWYYYCSYANLNGVYYHGKYYPNQKGFYDGIYWKDWMGFDYSLKFVSMSLYN